MYEKSFNFDTKYKVIKLETEEDFNNHYIEVLSGLNLLPVAYEADREGFKQLYQSYYNDPEKGIFVLKDEKEETRGVLCCTTTSYSFLTKKKTAVETLFFTTEGPDKSLIIRLLLRRYEFWAKEKDCQQIMMGKLFIKKGTKGFEKISETYIKEFK